MQRFTQTTDGVTPNVYQQSIGKLDGTCTIDENVKSAMLYLD